LSEPVPYRIFADSNEIATWLADDMAQGVYDSLEHQALSGDGSGENVMGCCRRPGSRRCRSTGTWCRR
jgi:hypothetical protein